MRGTFVYKCQIIYFNGDPNGRHICHAGGTHEPEVFDFGLRHDEPVGPERQGGWLHCANCDGVFLGKTARFVLPRNLQCMIRFIRSGSL